jgi:hypothetical protein
MSDLIREARLWPEDGLSQRLADALEAEIAKRVAAEARVKELEADLPTVSQWAESAKRDRDRIDAAHAEGVAEGICIGYDAQNVPRDGIFDKATIAAAERRIAARVVGAMSDRAATELRATLLAAYGSATWPSHTRAALQRAIEEDHPNALP